MNKCWRSRAPTRQHQSFQSRLPGTSRFVSFRNPPEHPQPRRSVAVGCTEFKFLLLATSMFGVPGSGACKARCRCWVSDQDRAVLKLAGYKLGPRRMHPALHSIHWNPCMAKFSVTLFAVGVAQCHPTMPRMCVLLCVENLSNLQKRGQVGRPGQWGVRRLAEYLPGRYLPT